MCYAINFYQTTLDELYAERHMINYNIEKIQIITHRIDNAAKIENNKLEHVGKQIELEKLDNKINTKHIDRELNYDLFHIYDTPHKSVSKYDNERNNIIKKSKKLENIKTKLILERHKYEMRLHSIDNSIHECKNEINTLIFGKEKQQINMIGGLFLEHTELLNNLLFDDNNTETDNDKYKRKYMKYKMKYLNFKNKYATKK